MLRIHLDAESLAKIRFATAPAPLDETMMSLRLLNTGPNTGPWGEWRRRTRARLPQAALPLLDLVRLHACTPALPGTLIPDLDAALELVASTRADVLQAEFAATYPDQLMPLWVRELARADRDAMALFTSSVRSYYRSCLQPERHQIRAAIDADVAYRSQTLRLGLGHLLSSLHPQLRWRPPYLELDRGEVSATTTLCLDGRGLLLTPSAFCGRPLVGVLPTGDVAIAYPTVVPFAAASAKESDVLAPLLGATRAGVLQALRSATHTTTELAHALNISAANASEHTAVLRRAGLITTTRRGQSVLHRITALGTQLLHGQA